MGLGGHPTSTDGFILGPSHGTVGRLLLFLDCRQIRDPADRLCLLPAKLAL